ncbi:MAG: SUF system NifU family Fe-S cluster assembly protein [Candidatus Omnitrophica bacterium]|nr:SUF system NifU family Fe-S cluster assembly protein [Candidatus Omnitrophota bacterium]
MVSSELRELYQELILDHSKKPRNFRALADANHTAEGFNPLCGDKLKLYLKVEGDVIQDIGFEGSGCAISKASTSMMTASVKGKSVSEAERLFHEFHHMLSGNDAAKMDLSKLGKLTVFAGVSEFPVRVKCATLAWHTLKAGLESDGKVVSTEE